MSQGISEIFGEATGEDGEDVAIYRALRALLCSRCGAPIPLGSLFTRKSVPGIGPRILPRCIKCAPFELKKERKAEESKMIENLLSTETDEHKKENAPRRDINKEVTSRLGPALSRSRRNSD